MARQPRFNIPGCPQHVIQRGNNRSVIFASNEDYQFYLEKLKDGLNKYDCALHVYVLMTNHVHLLVTPNSQDGISKLMPFIGKLKPKRIVYVSCNPAKMQAWLQHADALTDELEAGYLGNKQNIRKAYKELLRAISCEGDNYSDMGQDYDDMKYVSALVINTRLRRDAHVAVNQALDGTVIRFPKFKNPCKNNY